MWSGQGRSALSINSMLPTTSFDAKEHEDIVSWYGSRQSLSHSASSSGMLQTCASFGIPVSPISTLAGSPSGAQAWHEVQRPSTSESMSLLGSQSSPALWFLQPSDGFSASPTGASADRPSDSREHDYLPSRSGKRLLSRSGSALSGLTGASQSQNARAQQVEAWMERRALSSSIESRPARASSKTMTDLAAQGKAETDASFEQDLLDTQKTLDQSLRSIRMIGYMDKDKGDREAEEAAEERRRQAEYERKMAKKAKEAHQPQRRVELKIQHCRKFQTQTPNASVPMASLELIGGKGAERIPVVDVTKLQNKALGLQIGGASNVEKMMGLFDEVEKKKKWRLMNYGDKTPDDFVEINTRKVPSDSPRLRRGPTIGYGPKGPVRSVESRQAERNRANKIRRNNLWREKIDQRIHDKRFSGKLAESKQEAIADGLDG
eukprot:gnl/TRDRNA2_/TRDRNA2_190016_c0_seq1.p1 gnl/TRDRNA2_/TRDRNA2_190016_c0~~gnl/TRDRNA2_/TRDRNA2_190016_c0_seq1.p1  ORF type:complete len:435 (+),score=76.71 gnl/TRDRNA2_/TRDRNA2_190016_c0_seq1:80-1384(+)